MMAGLSITDLPAIPGFELAEVSRNGCGCETEQQARREDSQRARLLRSSAKKATILRNRVEAESLANLLDYGDQEPPESLASKLHMRDVRQRIIGHVQRLLETTDLPVATVHLEPARQELVGSCLGHLDARGESNALRTALNEKGINQLAGAAILFQDLEHEAGTDTWRGGWHGLVIGDKIDAFDALRETRNYLPRLQVGNNRQTSRVRIIRKISDLDYHLTYLLKGSIYGSWEGIIDGRRVRSSKRRVPGHRHSQALLWLHAHSLDDLCQLIGVRVGKDGFFFTNGSLHSRSGALARPGDLSGGPKRNDLVKHT